MAPERRPNKIISFAKNEARRVAAGVAVWAWNSVVNQSTNRENRVPKPNLRTRREDPPGR